MEDKKDCSYWDELKEGKIKILLQTKDNKYYSGFVISCDKSGITFLDKFKNKMWFSFDKINSVEPYVDERAGKGVK